MTRGLLERFTLLCSIALVLFLALLQRGIYRLLFSLICLAFLVSAFIFKSLLRPVPRNTIGFFHPNAADGGGGERVLWSAIQIMQRVRPNLRIILYTKSGFNNEQLQSRALRNFNLRMESPVEIIPLETVSYLDPKNYPSFTLLLQALGSVVVAWEGLRSCVPEVFVDTSGWAFSYPLARLAGARVCCYVHYPTISVDMLSRVRRRTALYNNSHLIANSTVLTTFKTMYYEVFSVLYGFCGLFTSVVMVNSSWTREHIWKLWWRRTPPTVVYPPVDTTSLQALSLDRPIKELFLISVGQFRPEKNHAWQLEAYSKARKKAQNERGSLESYRVLSSKLKIVGSCRNEEDSARLEQLRQLTRKLELEECVSFLENVPFDELKTLLANAVGGLHTMVDEHFGICVVEYMAAGLIPIAHDSGGPKMDILNPSSTSLFERQCLGYLESTVEGYAQAIYRVLGMEQEDRLRIAQAARDQASLFSQENFQNGLLQTTNDVLDRHQS